MAWLGLEGKAAIVTGGASGIGETICHTLAEQGASVALADVNQETGTAAVEELKRRHGGDHIFEMADVTDSRDVEGLVAKTVAAFGKIDILSTTRASTFPGCWWTPPARRN